MKMFKFNQLSCKIILPYLIFKIVCEEKMYMIIYHLDKIKFNFEIF